MKPPLFKMLAAAAVAAGITGLAAKWHFARPDGSLTLQLAAWNQEKSELEAQLSEARRKANRTVVNTAPTPDLAVEPAPGLSPEEIIAKLKATRVGSPNDFKTLRLVVHQFGLLTDMGPRVLPVIRDFLNKFEDVDYTAEARRADEPDAPAQPQAADAQGGRGGRNGGPGGRGGPGGFDFAQLRDFARDRRSTPRMSFNFPPSMRIGLFDVLRDIGGPEAEATLAEVLSTSGRGVEIAYVAQILNEAAPNKYREIAVTSAKDLLTAPPTVANPNRLDERSKDYLYYVLSMFGDNSFAGEAQGLLVTADGKIDRNALSYLSQSLKAEAMPAIFQAFNDPRVTNQTDKASLMALALEYAGPNAQANEMLNAVVSSEDLPFPAKAMALTALTRGEPDADLVKARQPVVEALKGSTTDERMLRALDVTAQNLQNILDGKPVDNNLMRMMRQGRGGPPQDGPQLNDTTAAGAARNRRPAQ